MREIDKAEVRGEWLAKNLYKRDLDGLMASDPMKILGKKKGPIRRFFSSGDASLPASYKIDFILPTDGHRWSFKNTLPIFDQLACSMQPDRVVLDLVKKGYGVWPIPANLRFDDLNLESVRLNLDREQRELITQNEAPLSVSEENSFWFNKGSLISNSKVMPQEYHPSLAEALFVLSSHARQEGNIPDTRGRWFLTRSGLNIDLSREHERIVGSINPKKMIFDACIDLSDYSYDIVQALNVPGDFSEAQEEEWSVERKGDTLTMENSWGDTIFEKKGSHYLFVNNDDCSYTYEEDSDSSISISSDCEGVLRKEDEEEDTVFEFYYSTLAAEIEAQEERNVDFFEREIFLPLLVSSNKEGVRVGVYSGDVAAHLIYYMANNNLSISYLGEMMPVLDKKAVHLPLSSSFNWPKIVADSYAHNLH